MPVQPVRDPALLAALEQGGQQPGQPVTDPALLAELDGGAPGQNYALGLGSQALQGMSLGWADEAIAGGRAALMPFLGDPRARSDIYREELGGLQSGMQQFQQENPVASIGANLAGGLVTGGGALRGAQALSGGAVTGARNILGAGTALGATAGAGSAAPGETLTGAVTGAGLGALTAGTVSGIGSVLRGAKAALAPGVGDRLRALAKASGLTPAQMQTRLRALGPRATLADVDDAFQRAADVAASRLGPTSRRVRDLIRRDETQFGRLMEPIRRTLGGEAAAARTVAELKDLRMSQASPLYEQAFAQPIAMTNRLRDLLARPATQQAWRRVQALGKSDPDIDVAMLKGGADPSFRGWQAVTEQLSDRVDSLRRSGQNKSAAIIGRLRKTILDELDAQSPTFREARGLWAGTKAADDALELGETFLKATPSQVRETLSTLTEPERAFYRLGMGRAIEERLARTNDTTDLGRLFRNQAFRQKAESAFPDTGSAVDFINTVTAETIKKRTTNLVGRGSQTAARQVAERQLAGAPIGPEDATSRGLLARGLAAVSQPRERTIQQLGDLLLSQDPRIQQQALGLLAQPRPGALRLGTGGAGGASTAGLLGARK